MVTSSSGPKSEARSHPRHIARKIVYYYFGDKRFLALTLDLGMGGMKIKTSHSFSKNEHLDIQLVLGNKSILLKGRTVYNRLLSDKENISGIQFVEVSEQDRSSLQDYIASL